MEKASPTSIMKDGMGRNSTTRMMTMPSAKKMSRLLLAGAAGVSVSVRAMVDPFRARDDASLAGRH